MNAVSTTSPTRAEPAAPRSSLVLLTALSGSFIANMTAQFATTSLADIQGGILRAYGRQGFPKARCLFLTIRDPVKGRHFVEQLRPRITTAARWKNPERGEALTRTRNPRVKDVVRAEGAPDYPGEVQLMKPKVTFNIAFTFFGLVALEVPTRTLRAMPDEFSDGRARRAPILGDEKFLETRDAVWRRSEGKNRVHMLVQLNAEMNSGGTPIDDSRETRWLRNCARFGRRRGDSGRAAAPTGGLAGHVGGAGRQQDSRPDQQGAFRPFRLASAILSSKASSQARRNGCGRSAAAKISKGQSMVADRHRRIPARLSRRGAGSPGAAMPIRFSRNGTFMAYRKLHENVGSFATYITSRRALRAFRHRQPRRSARDGEGQDGRAVERRHAADGRADLPGLANIPEGTCRRHAAEDKAETGADRAQDSPTSNIAAIPTGWPARSPRTCGAPIRATCSIPIPVAQRERAGRIGAGQSPADPAPRPSLRLRSSQAPSDVR